MDSEEFGKNLSELHVTKNSDCNGKSNALEDQAVHRDVQITCFTEDLHDVTIHFQIIRLVKQATAERKLIEKLKSLGYIRPRPQMTTMASYFSMIWNLL